MRGLPYWIPLLLQGGDLWTLADEGGCILVDIYAPTRLWYLFRSLCRTSKGFFSMSQQVTQGFQLPGAVDERMPSRTRIAPLSPLHRDGPVNGSARAYYGGRWGAWVLRSVRGNFCAVRSLVHWIPGVHLPKATNNQY